MSKQSVFAGLNRFYEDHTTGYLSLPFVYNNIVQLKDRLESGAWTTSIPLLESAAARQNIFDTLAGIIKKCKDGDWLLFYYTGHAEKYYFAAAGLDPRNYCVTFTDKLKVGFTPELSEFFSEIDYAEIVRLFSSVPGGHLITILDCCFASGLIKEFGPPRDFHTVIAAAGQDSGAGYNSNSAFFTAFMNCADLPFDELQEAVNIQLAAMDAPNRCEVRPAAKFKHLTLNHQ